MTDNLDPRTVPQLLAALSADLRRLFADTVGLAQAEIRRTGSALGMAMAGIVAGTIVLLLGVMVLTAALVLIGVAIGLPAWGAALLVGVLLSAGGAVAVGSFVAQLKVVNYNLEETRRSVAETMAWLRSQTLP